MDPTSRWSLRYGRDDNRFLKSNLQSGSGMDATSRCLVEGSLSFPLGGAFTDHVGYKMSASTVKGFI